jgi:hypothetical protein
VLVGKGKRGANLFEARGVLRGDQLNLMLAAAAWNFRKWMRLFTLFWLRLLCSLPTQNFYLPLQRIT